jgi:hypothetical protein
MMDLFEYAQVLVLYVVVSCITQVKVRYAVLRIMYNIVQFCQPSPFDCCHDRVV